MNPWDAARDGKYEVLEYVLKSDASLANRKDDNDVTPLCYAVIGRKPASVDILMKYGAKVNVPSKTSTPITFAAMDGNVEMVKLLIKLGAKILNYNKHGLSPLHAAVTANSVPIIKLLAEYKPASLNYNTPSVGTPLILACVGSPPNVVETLIELGADVKARRADNGRNALHSAVESGNFTIAKLLIEKCLSEEKELLDVAGNDGMTALNMASYSGFTNIVSLLIDHGVSIDKGTGDDNTSSLSLAAQEGKLDTLKVLVERGANVNHKSDIGTTPLHSAACCIAENRIEVMKYLIEKNANLSTQDSKGNTPAHFSAMRGTKDIMDTLLQAGADFTLKNDDGKTPEEVYTAILEQMKAEQLKQLQESHASSASSAAARACNEESCDKVERRVGEFKRCGRCKSVYYCSQGCQLKDWKIRHKKECKKASS